MNVNNSILNDIKKLLGLAEADTSFDADVIIFINDCFERLHDLGVGPSTIFGITDKTTTWSEFFGEDTVRPRVVSYMFKYVKVRFDPPTGGVLTAYENQISEAEWLLNAAVDPTSSEREAMSLTPLWGEESSDE